MEVMESATVSEKEEIRLFLIGKTGSGKSETGNTILGKKMFPTSPLMSSKTKACTLKRNLRNGTMIEVLDTVGFLDTHKTMIETMTAVVTAVVSMHPGPHAILYILKIERFTAEVMDSYKFFKSYFDDAISKYTILVLTHGDDLEREGLTLDDVMKDAPEAFRMLCAEVDNRVVIFNNFAEDKDHQVNRLLQVVRAMMSENRNIPYSSSKYAYAGYLVDTLIDLGMMTTATATVNNIPKSPYQMYDRVNSTSSDIISGSHHNEENREAEVRIQEIDERERTLREKEELLKRQEEVNEQERLLNIRQKELLQKEEEMIKILMQGMKEREEKERTLKEREEKIISQVREEEKKRKEREEKEAKGENRRDYRRRFIDGSEEEDSIFERLVNFIIHVSNTARNRKNTNQNDDAPSAANHNDNSATDAATNTIKRNILTTTTHIRRPNNQRHNTHYYTGWKSTIQIGYYTSEQNWITTTETQTTPYKKRHKFTTTHSYKDMEARTIKISTKNKSLQTGSSSTLEKSTYSKATDMQTDQQHKQQEILTDNNEKQQVEHNEKQQAITTDTETTE